MLRCSGPHPRRSGGTVGCSGASWRSPTSGACGIRSPPTAMPRPGATVRCRVCGSATPRWPVRGRRRWRRSRPRSSAPRWVSPPSRRWALMADALDLRHRFPLLWAKVEDLSVAPWKTRRVADATRSPAAGGRSVGGCAARRAHRWVRVADHRATGRAGRGAVRTRGAGRAESAARSQHYVRLTHPRPGDFAGTSYLEAAGDTPGPDRVLRPGPRRSASSWGGWVTPTTTRPARPRPSVSSPPAREPWSSPTRPPTAGRSPGGRCGRSSTSTSPSPTSLPRPAAESGGRGGRRGSARPPSTSSGRGWTARGPRSPRSSTWPAPTPSTPTTRPPGCGSRSSSATATACSPGAAGMPGPTDLDHIEAYVPPDEGGPPGQTHPHNLAPLCRRHHRAKTFTGWHYERARDGTYEWTSPHGHTYTVGPHGTRRTSSPARGRPGGVHPRHLKDPRRAG